MLFIGDNFRYGLFFVSVYQSINSKPAPLTRARMSVLPPKSLPLPGKARLGNLSWLLPDPPHTNCRILADHKVNLTYPGSHKVNFTSVSFSSQLLVFCRARHNKDLERRRADMARDEASHLARQAEAKRLRVSGCPARPAINREGRWYTIPGSY